jgi:hypothetical protein
VVLSTVFISVCLSGRFERWQIKRTGCGNRYNGTGDCVTCRLI